MENKYCTTDTTTTTITLVSSVTRMTAVVPLNIFPEYSRDVFGPAYFTSPLSAPVGAFLKRPKVFSCNAYDVFHQIMDEAAVYSSISKHPHKNLSQYLGAYVRQNRVLGFFLKRYPCTLADRVGKQCGAINIDNVLEGLKDAVKHLHWLGFCHNDIHLDNIMLDEHDEAVLIDFDFASYSSSRTNAPVSNPVNDWNEVTQVETILSEIDNT